MIQFFILNQYIIKNNGVIYINTMPAKIYCGAKDVPKKQKRGTMKQCA